MQALCVDGAQAVRGGCLLVLTLKVCHAHLCDEHLIA